jgi:hypothetical protein
MTLYHITALLAVTLAHALFRRLDEPEDKQELTADGWRYLHMGRGGLGYKPFHRRWLLPLLLKDNEKAWGIFTLTCTTLLPLATFIFLKAAGLSPNQSLFGGLLVLGLPAVFRLNLYYPVLVDAPSHLFAILSASSFIAGHWPLGLFLIVVGGCIKESVPVFSMLFQLPFSFNLLSLFGLISPIYTTFFEPQASKDIRGEEHILDHPIQSGVKTHKGRWFSLEWMLLPWGVCLLAFLNGPMLPFLFFVLLTSYGQVLISYGDIVRHYQAAFPLMIYSTVAIAPTGFYAILLLAHWFNPWQRHMT